MYILGISCFYHESAACLIYKGKVIAASSEERFSRKKHDSQFPSLAVKFCLKKAGITKNDLDYVVFYEKPFWKFHRILYSALSFYPFAYELFSKAMITWLTDKLWTRSKIASEMNILPKKILFVPHHISHAAASFYPSGFEKSAILTVDGVGEWTTATLSIGDGKHITVLSQMLFPHSLGLLYSVFTAFLGFEVNDGEYKVMGMAPYGRPVYLKKIKKLVTVFSDGSFKLNMEYFSYHKTSDKSYSDKFLQLFGKSRPVDMHFFTRTSGYPSYFGKKPHNYKMMCKENQRYADIASSIQAFTEEVLLLMGRSLFKKTKLPLLCMGGGVALNSVANGKMLMHGPFKNIFIQPAAGDDGGAMGAALYAYHSLLGKKRSFIQKTSYFGIEFTNKEIEKYLKSKNIPFTKISSEKKLISFIVRKIIDKKVIGFFHGKAEWGPRALGARSILADPRQKRMKENVNTKIKFREPYRPFAPVILMEKAKEYFEFGDNDYTDLSNFMLGVFPVKKSMRKNIPAVVHVDGSARPQIISEKQNKRYYNLVKEFGRITGVPVLMNTSFNLKGEPIVNSPDDAYKTFVKSGLDFLVLENCIISKRDIQ